MNKGFKVNYLAKDFSTIREELKTYAKRYYSETLGDLSDASINSFLIDSVAYVGDILSYYLDYQTNETFLSNAIEEKNILKLAKTIGYKSRTNSSSCGKIAMFLFLPVKDGKPDFSKGPTIKKGSVFTSTELNFYTSTEDVKIDQSLVGDNYVVSSVNTFGAPNTFAVKVYIPVVSGRILETNVQIDSFIKFNKVYLEDETSVEIISITDSDGNEYHEVPNLSQNIVYKSVYDANSNPKYSLKPISAQRRFVFDNDTDGPYLLFGGTQYKPDDDLTINPIVEPSKFILNKYNNDYLQDEFFDPNFLLNGDNFGIGPDNTVLRIRYRSNNVLNNNAAAGEITKIESLLYYFDNDVGLDEAEIDTIINSAQVINEEPIIGENTSITLDEIKDLSGQIFNSQGRAVTSKDYESLVYLMPQKYGSVKRVKAIRDPGSLKNNINLYVSCIDTFGFLTKSNTKIKENIKMWLSDYKIITDTVDILDAKIINLGIKFVIRVDPSENKMEVLDMVRERLKFIYGFKPQIGQAFSILDIYREIRRFNKVLDVVDLKIINKTGEGYSGTYFNIEQNLSSDGNIIKIPKNAIYEVRYLTNTKTDIVGSAI